MSFIIITITALSLSLQFLILLHIHTREAYLQDIRREDTHFWDSTLIELTMTVIDEYINNWNLFLKDLQTAEEMAAKEPEEQHLWKNYRDSLYAMIKKKKNKRDMCYLDYYEYMKQYNCHIGERNAIVHRMEDNRIKGE